MKVNYTGNGKVFFHGNEYDCDLFLNEEQGGILLKISVYGQIASSLELPIEMDSIAGELSTGFRFTLLGCIRKKLNHLISYGKSEFSYSAEYLIKGIGGKDAPPILFNKMAFQLSDIIEWGDVSGYFVGDDYELKQNDNTDSVLYQDKDFAIRYVVNSTMLPIGKWDLLKENITLKQSGIIEIAFNDEKPIYEFEEIYKKVKSLIELSMLKTVTLKKLTGWTKDNKRKLEKDEIEWPVEIISYDFFDDKIDEDVRANSYRWICLPELVANKSFQEYFKKYETLKPVVELYVEILESREMSAVRAFLNITQALETYHARFKANELKEFRERVENVILKNSPQTCIKYRDFLTKGSGKQLALQSRLADLFLAEFKIYFDTGDIDFYDFPRVIAKTRNYYTHYNESIKETERVLTEEELVIYNNVLLYILEYHLLSELGFDNIEEIKKKLNFRFGNTSLSLSIRKKSKEIFGEEKKETQE